jgi:Mce-associated membrane protein
MADDAAAPQGELTRSAGVELTDTEAAKAEEKAPRSHDSEAATGSDVETDEADGSDEEAGSSGAPEAPVRAPMSHVAMALIAGLVAVVALAGLTGWLGYRTYESHKAQQQRNLFLQVGRQGALNLTTIDWEHADADVQRILDSSTGTFYDDFQQRAQPFVSVVKQAQSKSVGTIAEAGVESASDDKAQVLVAVTVKTSNAGAPQQGDRSWRMRISVDKVGNEAKVSNVEFVP